MGIYYYLIQNNEEEDNMMIYVSGKITGDKNYKLKFEKAANKLISFGYDVFNPAILPNGLEYEQYMQIDFLALSFCQGIYLLDDWEQSSGAKRELEEAKRLGLKVITEDDFMYSDTLVQICNDTENIIESDADQDFENKVYDKRLQKITNMVRTAAFFHDLGKTKEENFEVLCKDIPENERDFFFKEFLRDAHIMIDYDYIEEDSCQQKKRLEKMFVASQEMRDLCSSLYGYSKERRYSLSA